MAVFPIDIDSSRSNDVSESSSASLPEPCTSSVDSEPCQCRCCLDPHTPFQPLEVAESEIKSKSFSRRIQCGWYKSFPWISVCSSSFKIFCTKCCSAKLQGLLSFPKHYKSAFIDDSFECCSISFLFLFFFHQSSLLLLLLLLFFVHCNSQTTQATELTQTRTQIAPSILITFHIKKDTRHVRLEFQGTATVSYSTRHRNSTNDSK